MEWLWKRALVSASKRAVQAAIAYLGQDQVQRYLGTVGVQISIDPALASAALYGALEFLRSWLKVKAGIKQL